jgi:glyoxylase I family protein
MAHDLFGSRQATDTQTAAVEQIRTEREAANQTLAARRVAKIEPLPAQIWPPFCQDRAMTPLGIHHVNLTVGDLEASRQFYVDVLGLTVRTDRPDFPFPGWWLDVGAQQVHLIVGDVANRVEHGDHFAIQVEDIDATVDELRGHGVTVSAPRGVGLNRQCFLRDPWGNLVELQQVA